MARLVLPNLEKKIRQRASQVESKLIAWRRDIHQYPELAEQETRTSGLVAGHLGKLRLEVKTGVARTGVIAILKGGKPGPVVALRADMDALPVKEPTAHQSYWAARSCRLSLAHHRSGHDGRADRARTADGGEPAHRFDEVAGRGQCDHHQRRLGLEYRARERGDDGHDPRV